MIRRARALLLVLAALAVTAALAGVATAADDDGTTGAQITDAGTGLFPDRAFVITLPESRRLTNEDVRVTEDGRAVAGSTVVAANAEGGVGTVILIDASNSMKGSIDDAMAAARRFAAGTKGQAISIVTFNDKPTVVQPFTYDPEQIQAALAKAPQLAEGTRIYDALSAAQAQVRDAKLGAGRIVLISDGSDVGSTLPASTVTDALANEKVRVYTIGIDSPDLTEDELAAIAEKTGGEFALAASSGQIQGILDGLQTKAEREYVLRYRSEARPGSDVDVAVTVVGVPGTLETAYTSPRPGQGTYEESFADTILQGWPLMLLVSGLVIGLAIWGVMKLLELRSNRRLRRRLGDYVEVEEEAAKRRSQVSALTAAAADAPSSRLGEMGWYKRFALEVDIAGIKSTPQRLLLWALAIGVAIGVILASLVSPFLFLVFLLPPFILWVEVQRRARRTRSLFQEQLDDNLEVLGSGLRAGHSLVGAMSMMVDEAEEPSRSEFRRVVNDERLGVPLDEALEVTATRMRSTDLDQVALLALIQREAGGNMAEVLDKVIENIRAREEVRRLVRVLTAQGRLAKLVIIGVPIALFGFILLVNPDQLQPLFHDPIGQVSLVMAVIGIILGSWIIGKIIDIEL